MRWLDKVRVPQLSRRALVWLLLAGGLLFIGILWLILRDQTFPLLQTRGEIAHRERDLLLFATGLALLVLIPVYAMLFLFAWRYRQGHRREYKPDWDSNKTYEVIWWGIPIVIILVLGVVTWITSHSLDPYKPLTSHKKPLQVQVIAMEWKWLFLYPDYNVASVNEVAFPVDTPVEFTITSDGAMNSFWVPQLAGQIYAMSGMSTKLHVSADRVGDYKGLSSNVSGPGFSDMKFTARAVSEAEFRQWLARTRTTGRALDRSTYDQLRAKSVNNTVSYYSGLDGGLYDRIVMSYGDGPVARPNEVKTTDEKASSQTKEANHTMEEMHR